MYLLVSLMIKRFILRAGNWLMLPWKFIDAPPWGRIPLVKKHCYRQSQPSQQGCHSWEINSLLFSNDLVHY